MSSPMPYWSITSELLREEALLLGLEVEILIPEKNLFYIRSSDKEILFKSNDFGGNSSLAAKIVDDKEMTHIFLSRMGAPIPGTEYILTEMYDAYDWETIAHMRYPLVIKPLDQSHGNGVRMNIESLTELQDKLRESLKIYPKMIIQEQISGDECRVLVFMSEVVLAYNRLPPVVTGDGKSTIEELIASENKTNPLRNEGYHAPLSMIKVDDELIHHISLNNYTLKSVLDSGISLQLRGNSNVGTGGTIQEITHLLHPQTIQLCSDIAKKLSMELCCIDIVSSDFTRTLSEAHGTILEVGGNPGFGGSRELTSVNPAKVLLQKLFF